MLSLGSITIGNAESIQTRGQLDNTEPHPLYFYFSVNQHIRISINVPNQNYKNKEKEIKHSFRISNSTPTDVSLGINTTKSSPLKLPDLRWEITGAVGSSRPKDDSAGFVTTRT